MSKVAIKAIVACDPNGVIAVDGKIPWPNISRDMLQFRALTEEQAVVMGHNTWCSLPKRPLPRRINIILGKTFPKPAGLYGMGETYAVDTLGEAVELTGVLRSRSAMTSLYVIGGERVYWEVIHPNAAYPATEVYLTRMIQRVTANVGDRVNNRFFPMDLLEKNYELSSHDYYKDLESGIRMCFERWARKVIA